MLLCYLWQVLSSLSIHFLYVDATTNFWGQTVSKKDARKYDKAKKKGNVEEMRKILQIPVGKEMPGMPELGNGK